MFCRKRSIPRRYDTPPDKSLSFVDVMSGRCNRLLHASLQSFVVLITPSLPPAITLNPATHMAIKFNVSESAVEYPPSFDKALTFSAPRCKAMTQELRSPCHMASAADRSYSPRLSHSSSRLCRVPYFFIQPQTVSAARLNGLS